MSGLKLTDHQCRRLAEIAERISSEAPERQRAANWQVLVQWYFIDAIRAILNEGMAAYWADYHIREIYLKAYRSEKERNEKRNEEREQIFQRWREEA